MKNTGKNKELGSIHIAFVAVLVAMLLGGIGYVFWSNFLGGGSVGTEETAKNIVQAVESKKTTQLPESKPAGHVIDLVKSYMQEKYSSKVEWIYGDEIAHTFVTYSPEGSHYFVSTEAIDVSVVFNNVSSYHQARAGLVELLKDNKIGAYDIRDFGLETDSDYRFRSSNVLCEIVINDNTNYLQLSCSDVADYATAIAVVEPLVEAYKKSDPSLSGLSADTRNEAETKGKIVFANTPDIKRSKTGAYKYAIAAGGMYFYKKDGGNWRYFMTDTEKSNFPISCSVFNSEELRTAFAGVDCFDKSRQTTREL